MNGDSERVVGIMNRPENASEEAGPSKSRLEEDVISAMSFTELLKDNSCPEMDQSNKLDEKMIRAFVSAPVLSSRRGTQVPSLEFSLMPSSHSLDFFPATPSTPRHQLKSLQKSPSSGFPFLNWGGASPSTESASNQTDIYCSSSRGLGASEFHIHRFFFFRFKRNNRRRKGQKQEK